MLETLLCALVTLLPDYLFRRYVQGKRIGQEITFFSMWYELRWGLISCAMLAITLFTILFYYHPATSNVTSYFRTLTILPQGGGRVAEVYVTNNQEIEAGAPIFRLDDASQRAALETAKTKIVEVEASRSVAEANLATAKAQVMQAEAALAQSEEELARNQELLDRGSGATTEAEVQRNQNIVNQRRGQLDAAKAQVEAAQQQIDVVIPAQKASAEASLNQAQAELDKTLIVAGVDGRIEQLSLQVGDFVSPIMRPAGILVPNAAERRRFQAGFNQMGAQVIKPGMIGEIGCMTQPFTIVPMVVVDVQSVIPSGQIRPSDRLLDPQDNIRPGSLLVYLEPLYKGFADEIPPGSTCLANIYSDHHELIASGELGTAETVFFHAVDTIGVIHAAGIRLRMILMPIQTLVLSGSH